MSEVFGAVLAAGLGKRMKSDLPKILHPILGRPMLLYVLEALSFLPQEDVHIIVGHKADLVKEEIGGNYSYVLQEKQLGTGHALMQLAPYLSTNSGTLLVVPGDMPLIQRRHLEQLFAAHKERRPLATILTTQVEDPSSLGRIIRQEDGSLLKIVEESDAAPSELQIKEVCTSVYTFKLPDLFRFLRMIKPENAQREYYLTDVLPLMQAEGKVEVITVGDIPYIGVNDREQLLLSQGVLRSQLFSRLMKGGVTLEDTNTIFIDWDVKIGRDTVIRPFTLIEGRTVVGQSCVLGPFLWLKDARIDDNSVIKGRIERS
jgi:bifunctional UDP-N-acetylglucosamine pyrophosphorylase/glucosamine-1-phosphate N-acetyltransferase